MSLSRRTFTKEFKEGAVRRLEFGASLAGVRRACGVNPGFPIAGGNPRAKQDGETKGPSRART
jgi:hypothetical protein